MISGKLSACANSGYQALTFPTHQEPGYEANHNVLHTPSRCTVNVSPRCSQKPEFSGEIYVDHKNPN